MSEKNLYQYLNRIIRIYNVDGLGDEYTGILVKIDRRGNLEFELELKTAQNKIRNLILRLKDGGIYRVRWGGELVEVVIDEYSWIKFRDDINVEIGNIYNEFQELENLLEFVENEYSIFGFLKKMFKKLNF